MQGPEAVAPAAYPAVVKPALALYEVDGRLARPTGAAVADEAELERVREKGWHPPLVVQPLINGTGEGLFGHVTRDGSVAAWSAHRRVRMLNPEGSALVGLRVDPGRRRAWPALPSASSMKSAGTGCSCSSSSATRRAGRG